MPNDFFQFQQFRIEQGHCAMKVSTDACLLGAAVDLTGATRLLDLGTGTGLLALMAAQRHPAVAIEAVEIDLHAAAQAATNVAASPWSSRIKVHALSLADYAHTGPASFSHVVCNPPFFQESLPSPHAARRTARHAGEASLSFLELAQFSAASLLPQGTLTVLLPPPEMGRFTAVAQAAGLHHTATLEIRHRPGGRVTRHISSFGHQHRPVTQSSLCILDAAGLGYSAEFQALLAGFYLAF